MKRKVVIFGLLWLMLLGCPLIILGLQIAPAKKKVDLKVVYVGQVDTDRTKGFVKLLSDNFSKVEMLDQEKFGAKEIADFDVVVLDYIRARGVQGAGLQLPEGYSKPTVVFGSFGKTAAFAWLKPTTSYT